MNRGAVVAALLAATLSCRDATGPTTGAARVGVMTAGLDLDADGYTLTVDGDPRRSVAAVDAITIRDLASGSHTMALDGVAAHCTVGGDTPRTVIIIAGDTADVTFEVGCAPTFGIVRVTTATSGANLDVDGFVLELDGGPSWPVGMTDSVLISAVSVGVHTLELRGVAPNCAAGGGPHRDLTIAAGNPGDMTRPVVDVAFAVTCAPTTGSLRVTTATSGTDLDPNGYTVRVDDRAWHILPTNGSIIAPGPWAVGEHLVELRDVAANCTVAGANPQTVTLTSGDTTEVAFAVACTALSATGDVAVTTATTGAGLGFSVRIYNAAREVRSPIGLNDRRNFPQLPPGSYLVALDSLPENCRSSDENPQVVSVTEGQTSPVAFSIECARVDQIAVSSDWVGTWVVYPSGAQRPLVRGMNHAAWSPDGMKLAYSSYDFHDILVLDLNDLRVTNLTDDANVPDATPAWSPDGSKIAFGRQGELYLVDADGSGLVQVTHQVGFSGNPAWSPDGRIIAFDCLIEGQYTDVCVIRADGTGFLRLTTDPLPDGGPAWSPDGSRIAFSTCRFSVYCDIAVMNPDGTGVATLPPGGEGGADAQPSWSPDGTRISYASATACEELCYGNVFVMNSDGAGRFNLAFLSSYTGIFGTAWRP